MKKAQALSLPLKMRRHLEKLVRAGKTPQKVARRARVVLLASDGLANTEIAAETGMSRQAVINLRRRFVDRGVECVQHDATRPGRKPQITDATIRMVVEKTLHTKPKNATHWTTRTMAEATGLSHMTIHRIWRAHKLQPHRTETFKLSTDPHFVDKLVDVVGLYLDPPDRAMVFSVDEKSQIQALDRSQPLLPMGPGNPERRSHDYYRHGTATLFAALSMADGKIIASVKKRHRHQEFLEFLKQIDRETSKKLDMHLIVDNYGTHKHPTIRAWLDENPRFHFHFIPTGSSWLNLVERWFAEITEKRIRRGVFKSVPQLTRALRSYVNEHNRKPKPIRWTAEVDEIIRKIGRCHEVLDTGH